METCIFCRIVRKELPAHTVYEDQDFIAFLDINPLSPGHTLVIPKQHYRWVWDVPASGAYFEIASKIARALQATSGSHAVHAKVVGEEVHHAHVWVYPDPNHTFTTDKKDFARQAEALRSTLSTVQ